MLWEKKCKEAGITDGSSPWKLSFIEQHNIEMNWRVKSIRSPKVGKGHNWPDGSITCLHFSAKRIATGSDDSTLKMWSVATGKCLRNLVGHTDGVECFQREDNVIVDGSMDRTLKVWNAQTGACERTLLGHTFSVPCLRLHSGIIVSRSEDKIIKMWDLQTGECLHVLRGHSKGLWCVQYDGRLLISGARDDKVKVWNPETEECLHTLVGHLNLINILYIHKGHIVSVSVDRSSFNLQFLDLAC